MRIIIAIVALVLFWEIILPQIAVLVGSSARIHSSSVKNHLTLRLNASLQFDRNILKEVDAFFSRVKVNDPDIETFLNTFFDVGKTALEMESGTIWDKVTFKSHPETRTVEFNARASKMQTGDMPVGHLDLPHRLGLFGTGWESLTGTHTYTYTWEGSLNGEIRFSSISEMDASRVVITSVMDMEIKSNDELPVTLSAGPISQLAAQLERRITNDYLSYLRNQYNLTATVAKNEEK